MLAKNILEKLNQVEINSAKKEFAQTIATDPEFFNINISDFKDNQKEISISNFSDIALPFYDEEIVNDNDQKELVDNLVPLLKNKTIVVDKKGGDKAKILINDLSYDRNKDELLIKKFAVQ